MPWMTMPSKNTEPKQILARGSASTPRNPATAAARLNGFGGATFMPRKAKNAIRRDQEAKTADREKHAAPAEQIADHARDHRADEIAGQPHGQQPADRHLPLMHRNQIANDGDPDRKNAAGAHPGDDAHRHQQREAADKRAEQRRRHDRRQTCVHQPGLAEEIGDRAQCRLHQRIGERKGARQ